MRALGWCVAVSLFLCPLASAAAPAKVGVLPVNGDGIDAAASTQLTDGIRAVGLNYLVPKTAFELMTRDNLEVMLPKGKTLADCVGTCAVNTAKLMKLQYVITTRVFLIQGQFRLTVGAYSAETSRPLRELTVGGASVNEVLGKLPNEVGPVFAAITNVGASGGRQMLGGSSGRVSFRSNVKATVTIDGRARCETPCEEILPLGRYTISMTKIGYVQKQRNHQILGDDTVEMTLVKDEGGLIIKSTPAGHAVYINGKTRLPDVAEWSQTPTDKIPLSPETYRVRVGEPRCAEPHEVQVSVARGKTVRINLEPAERKTGAVIEVTDKNGDHVKAEVYRKSDRVGEAFEHLILPLCTDSVTLVSGGHRQTVPLPNLKSQETSTYRVKWTGSPVFGGR